jgi:parvulin-like peptidyl-prolyl isomerase
MTVRDLVFPAAAAAAAEQALKSSQNVDVALAQYHGRDSGRVNGQEFYFAVQIHLGDRMFQVAKSLANGATSAPIPSSDGVHILYMLTNSPPVPETFEEARARALNDYQRAAIARLQTREEYFLRKRANVLIAKDLH